MLEVKDYISVFFVLICLNFYSQNLPKDNLKTHKEDIEKTIDKAKKDIVNFNYIEAIKKLNDAHEITLKTKDKKNEGLIYTLKGKLHLIINEQNDAIKSLNKAIKIQDSLNDNKNIGDSYKLLGDLYYRQKKYYKAIEQYRLAKSKFISEGLKKKTATILLSQAQTFLKLKHLKKAKTLNEEAITFAKENNDSKIESIALINIGNTYNLLKEYDKALQFTLQGILIAKNNNHLKNLNEGYLIISNVYQNIKNYKTSNKYLNLHIKLSDSLKTLRYNNHSPLNNRIQSLNSDIIKKNIEQAKELEKANYKNDFTILISILSVGLIVILSLLTLSLHKNSNIRLNTNIMLQRKNKELTIAKEKAELASKTKANFLSTVTHELRTPLYAVTTLSHILLKEDPKPEQIQYLKPLKISGDYLLGFIDKILQTNQIEANKINVDLEPFNLKKKINNIILALNNSAQKNNNKIHFQYENNLPENYISDKIKISQILMNLISNSIKFTKNGDIWIRVNKIKQSKNNYVLRFEIKDNGIGISKKKQTILFKSFSQGSIEINRKYGGTGLGLAIVKGLINVLNGKIYLKSELGAGTSFYFEIPMKQTNLKEEKTSKYFTEKTIKKHNLDNAKVLIVEDNKINQMITKKVLNKMNLKCDIIDNGTDAIKLVKENHYDIVLMDINMPGISGIEATKLIRKFNKELHIFALTAVTIDDFAKEFEDAGFTDIISKPFKQNVFEERLYKSLISKTQPSKL